MIFLKKFLVINILLLFLNINIGGLIIPSIEIANASISTNEISSIQKSAAELELKEVSNFINQLKIIRVMITAAPGNGHQSAGIAVIQRLQEMGYPGLIEVLYDHATTAIKIEHMLPLFRGITQGAVQNYPEAHLRFVYWGGSSAARKNLEQVPLAIMGADDEDINPELIKADALLKLQPRNWYATPTLNIDTPSFKKSFVLHHLGPLGIVLTPPDPENVDLFLNEHMSGPKYSAKLGFLSKLLGSTHSREILPVYGHGVRVGDHQLGNLIQALVSGGVQDPKAYSNGIVIPIINELNSKSLARLTDDLETILTNSRFEVDVYQYDDPKLLEIIDQKNDKRIILVKLGPVPKKVFEYLYKRETLPGIVEGLNSIHYMSIIGKPYLPSSFSEGFHFHEILSIKKITERFYGMGSLVNGAWRAFSYNYSLSDKKKLKEFYLQSYLNRDLIWSYFDNLKQNPQTILWSDQLFMGLRYYKKTVQNIFEIEKTPDGFEGRVFCQNILDFNFSLAK